MGDKITMTWKDGRGKEQVREVNQIIDVRDFVGTPGYALLLVAANTDLSVSDVLRFFDIDCVGRSRSWIQRRPWLFQQPGAVNAIAKPDRDGNEPGRLHHGSKPDSIRATTCCPSERTRDIAGPRVGADSPMRCGLLTASHSDKKNRKNSNTSTHPHSHTSQTPSWGR
jgi:hypothetical protein